MAKKFENLGDRSSNMKKGLSALLKPQENTLSTVRDLKLDRTKEEIETKFFNLPLPSKWHEKLKYDIARDTGKSLKNLILDAIAEKYGFEKT